MFHYWESLFWIMIQLMLTADMSREFGTIIVGHW